MKISNHTKNRLVPSPPCNALKFFHFFPLRHNKRNKMNEKCKSFNIKKVINYWAYYNQIILNSSSDINRNKTYKKVVRMNI